MTWSLVSEWPSHGRLFINTWTISDVQWLRFSDGRTNDLWRGVRWTSENCISLRRPNRSSFTRITRDNNKLLISSPMCRSSSLPPWRRDKWTIRTRRDCRLIVPRSVLTLLQTCTNWFSLHPSFTHRRSRSEWMMLSSYSSAHCLSDRCYDSVWHTVLVLHYSPLFVLCSSIGGPGLPSICRVPYSSLQQSVQFDLGWGWTLPTSLLALSYYLIFSAIVQLCLTSLNMQLNWVTDSCRV